MATPTISLATMGSSRKKSSNKSPKKDDKNDINSDQKPALSYSDKKLRKFWGEEQNEDSIYSIYLKKITYSIKYEDIGSLRLDDTEECVTRCDQTDSTSNKKTPKRTTTWYDDQQVCQFCRIFGTYLRKKCLPRSN